MAHTPATAHTTRTPVRHCPSNPSCLYCTGCLSCGLVVGQTPACTTACTPTAPCPACGTNSVCTGCGQCYNPACGLCTNCLPCTGCTGCVQRGNTACGPCWHANHNGTGTH